MSSNIPDFEKAEYLVPSAAPAYEQQTILSGDVDTHEWEAQQSDHGRFTKAIIYGLAAAILGSILYAAFTITTHIMIGYVAIGVGYLVGKAMLAAIGGHSSRKYQVAAALLTYVSVAMAELPEFLWALHLHHQAFVHISFRLVRLLVGFALVSPFIAVRHNTVSGLIGLLILFIGIRAAWKLTANRTIPQSGLL